MKKFADFIIEKRLYILIAIILITVFFLYQIVTKLTIKTIFNDLIPQNHPYVNLYHEIRDQFGGANQVNILVQVREQEDGGAHEDIFNFETLNIVKNIHTDIRRFHAVDPYKIMSLASQKIQYFEMLSGGFETKSIMYPTVPKTKEGLEALKKNVYATPMAYPVLVSFDSKKTLITVDFFEDELNYALCFKELKVLREKYEDKNHIIAISGEPMHLGYVHSYVKDVLKILLYTVLAMMFVFFLYFRSKRGMFLPILAAAISAIWGLGFLSLFGYNLDPLVLVFPFLISAMAASHAVQVIKRYMEEAQKNKDVKKSCKNVIEHLFLPGFAGIITDASGIVVIALTPIPILHKICLSCAYWAIVTIVIAMLLVPILLSYMPVRNLKQEQDFLDRLLQRIGAWIVGTGKYFVFTVSVLLLIVCSFFVNDVDIGHNFPGSELLWPWHRYNIDCTRIGFAMGTLLPLYVVAEGEEHQAIVDANVIRDIVSFSRHLEQTPDKRVLQAMSVIKTISSGHQMMRDNNLNWCFVPTKDSQASAIYRAILYQSGPGTWDKFIDRRDKTANIVVLCRDKTAETIRIVIERINDYIRNKSIFGIRQKDIERKGFDRFIYWVDGFFREKEAPIPEKPLPEGVPKVHYRLAGGSVGMQAAINEALTLYQIWTFILALMIVFILCSVIFRSFFAGMIITLPLVLANFLTFTLMSFGAPYISLTTATMPIASIGIGLGVDYGIYLVSRIIEEYKNNTSLEYAIKQALGTTGKAIIYIATTLMCGIMFWFFSKMMFQAMMGLLLGTILLFNMLGALLIIPSFIAIFKPKFVTGKIKN